MKNFLRNTLTALCAAGAITASAQTRYYEEIFDDSEIVIEKDVMYGVNVDYMLNTNLLDPDFISSNATQIATESADLKAAVQNSGSIPTSHYYPYSADPSTIVKISNLTMDVYSPDAGVDSQAERPVLFYIHTGNFLPPVINGGPTGSKEDSSAVEICKQWAKRGYVAVALNYRHGWNPTATGTTGTLVRRATLLNAVYRAIHDVKQAVRYVKNDAINGSNNWGVNTDKIGIYGQGSGGYVALAYNTLDEVEETEISKFINPSTGSSVIDPTIVGDIDGYGGLLNLYYDMGISADISVCVNAGGALGDISWLDGNEAPMISIHAIRDQYAPFDTGTVIVPTTGEDVVNVNGPNMFIPAANALGVNDAIKNFTPNSSLGYDPYTQRAQGMYGKQYGDIPNINIYAPVNVSYEAEGLFPLELEEGNGAPWEWWSFSDLQTYVAGVNALTGGSYDAQDIHDDAIADNPSMSETFAKTYIDSIQGYIHPRIMVAMEIGDWTPLNTNDVEKLDQTVSIFPNPANNDILVSSYEEALTAIKIVDLQGRVVRNEKLGNAYNYSVNVSDLPAGIYLVQLEAGEETTIKKLVIQ